MPRLLGPAHGGVQVGHHLRVGDFRNDAGHDLADVGHLRDVAFAGVQGGGDGEVAALGEPAADVLDVLVDAEYLLHDQHDRVLPARRGPGVAAGDVAVSCGYLYLARLQAVRVRVDRLGRDRLHGQGEPRRQRRLDRLPDELPPRL